MKYLIVIPARGGSKGIPRKNLRVLGSKPLLQYTLEAALGLKTQADIVITTDDTEIKLIARYFGVHVIDRNSDLCADNIPLDPVIYDAYLQMCQRFKHDYEIIITLQPTSPFISTVSINNALQKFEEKKVDTLFSAIDDTHLSWKENVTHDGFEPNYIDRFNRQLLPRNLKETGSIQICTREVITPESRIGRKVEIFELEELEGIDIDTPLQWTFCESIVRRRRWIFVIVGDTLTGSGHAFRVKTLAEWLAGEDLVFLCCPRSEIAQEIIESSNYKTNLLQEGNLAEQVLAYQPDIVVNDMLDTGIDYINRLKENGIFIVNFEDFGPGSNVAHLVFNALYHEEGDRRPHVFYGADYFCLRNEFRFAGKFAVRPNVKNILLSFGGTDPSNLVVKTLKAIMGWCAESGIDISIILGPGYSNNEELGKVIKEQQMAIKVMRSVEVMSEHMLAADICFTSCGRTVYELASLGIPTICMAQNTRETTHTFARLERGIYYLGRGLDTQEANILEALVSVAGSHLVRSIMHSVGSNIDLQNGVPRILKIIKQKYNQDHIIFNDKICSL